MSDATLDPGIVLKITPPKLRKNLLVRERLRGIRSDDVGVFLLEAPAGYGKTSLLAQWRLDWLQSGARVAWASVSADDGPAQVMSAIAESLRRAGAAKAQTRATAPASFGGGVTIQGLTALLAAIAEDAAHTVLIFDDFERASDPGVLEVLEYLLHNLPPNLQVAVGSRNAIPIETSDLIGHGNLRRVTAAELRFDLQEMERLLTARLGSRADPGTCGRLYEITQGWPLGVQLAAAALEGSNDWEAALARFSASREDATHRLFEGMIAAMPDDMARFIVRCALLEAMHPALCTAISGNAEAPLWLQRLAAETPLLTPVEDTEWLRMHPLAHQFLRAKAKADLSAEEQSAVHAQAMHWLSQHGYFAQAASSAIAAGREEDAYDLLYRGEDRGWTEAILQGDFEGTVERMQWLMAKNPPRQPRFMVLRGWGFLLTGRPNEAMAEVASLAAGADIESSIRDGATRVLICASLTADHFENALRLAASFSPELPDLRTAQMAACARGFASLYRGAAAEARRELREHPDDGRFGGVRIMADVLLGNSYLWEGRPRDVQKALGARYQRFLDPSGDKLPWTGAVATMLAAAHWEVDERSEARVLVATRMPSIDKHWSYADTLCTAYETASRMAAADGDDVRAFALLEHLESLSAERQAIRLRVVGLAERVRMHAARGRPTQCASLIDELDAEMSEAEVEPLLRPFLDLQAAMARAYCAFAEDDDESAAQHLESAWLLARQIKRARETIQILALRAVLAERAKRSPEQPLAEAIALAEAGGMIRVFADTLPEVVGVIRRWVDAGAAATNASRRRFLDQVLAAAEAPGAEARHVPATPSSGILTPKESEVLRLLAGGLSNKRIAASLGLSDETVKWHMKKLFTKLNAGNRQHAVDRARLLGLLA